MDFTKFDDLLMGILQHCEQVEPFLDAIFSFLARRTDFFLVMHNRDDKVGFAPGVAEKMVLKIFKTHQQIVTGNQTGAKKQAHGKISGKGKQKCADIERATDRASAANENTSLSAPMASSDTDISPAITSCEVETSPTSDKGHTQLPACTSEKTLSAASTSSSKPTSLTQVSEDVTSSESKGLVPGKTADCYNGAVLEKYAWSQTITDIEIKIPVPCSVTKGRDVGVEIKSFHLKVWLKNGIPPDSDSIILVDGKLQWPIKCEDSMWLLEAGKQIIVSLDKVEERFWTTVLEGDTEIDKTKVDTTRDISEFDEQTQSDFQHVMYDHHQKLQGKPTSQEMKTHDLLKKAWNAKGSPFAGTDFDPSKVNISPSYG